MKPTDSRNDDRASGRARPALPNPSPAIAAPRPGLLDRLLTQLRDWDRLARDRQRLAELDDRALADIGFTRERALAEAARPFWQRGR